MRSKVTLSLLIVFGLIAAVVYSAVLGIDLSSENIKVAAVRRGAPFHIVVDELGKRKVPVAVAFDDDERSFGNNAIGLITRKPLDTYVFAHRLIGQSIDSERTKDFQTSFDYKLVPLENRGNAVGIKTRKGEVYSPEELIAMSFEHVIKIAEEDGNVGARDAVVTIPWWFTSMEKQALLDAASLANVNIVSLITDTGASAISYGIDREYPNTNTTQHVIIIDIGSSGTEISLVEYTGVKQSSLSLAPNKIAGHAVVTHTMSSDIIGGHYIDRSIREYLLTYLSTQMDNSTFNPQKITMEQIRSSPRAMAKLLKESTRVKNILSANTELDIKMESLEKEVMLSTRFTREQLHQVIEEMLENLTQLCHNFIQSIPSDVHIDDIVIVGGTVRIPAIQNALKQGLKDSLSDEDKEAGKEVRLSQTINGDEAMAMGAVFVSANYSTIFQTKPFLFTDNHNADTHLVLHDEDMLIHTNYIEQQQIKQQQQQQASQEATGGEGVSGDDGNSSEGQQQQQPQQPQQQPGKHVLLFKQNSPINKRKTISLTRDKDFLVSLHHDSSHVCTGCHSSIYGYAIDGVEEIYQDYLKHDKLAFDKELSLGLVRNLTTTGGTTTGYHLDQFGQEVTPRGVRVAMTFNAIETSVPRLVHADVVIDDWVIVDDTAELLKKQAKQNKLKAAKAKKAAATQQAEATADGDAATADTTADGADSTVEKPINNTDDQQQNAGGEGNSSSGDASANGEHNNTEAGEEAEEPSEAPPPPSYRLEKRVRRIPLTIRSLDYQFDGELTSSQIRLTNDAIYVNGYLPLSHTRGTYQQSREKLHNLSKLDRSRRYLAEQENNLESLLFTIRGGIDYEEDYMMSVTTDAERVTLYALAETIAEWNDEMTDAKWSEKNKTSDWYNTHAEKITTQIQVLNDKYAPIANRYQQKLDREQLLQDLITADQPLLDTFTTLQQRAYILSNVNTLFDEYKQFKEKYQGLFQQQENTPLHDDPVFQCDVIRQELQDITMKLHKLARIPPPKPPVQPRADASVRTEEVITEEEIGASSAERGANMEDHGEDVVDDGEASNDDQQQQEQEQKTEQPEAAASQEQREQSEQQQQEEVAAAATDTDA